MPCIAPVDIENKKWVIGTTRFISVPCGKCPECLKRRSGQWAFRLQQEYRRADTAAFLTLTYSPENVPYTKCGLPSLDRQSHQKFMKRLRKNTTTNQKYKYYAVGEYGTETQRPHYHSILFNLPPDYLRPTWNEEAGIWTFDKLEKIWQEGHVHVLPYNAARVRYVTNYLQKNIRQENPDDPREREFSNMSKGIGENYLTPNIKAYYKKKLTPYILHQGGEKMSMPRYYKNKLYNKKELEIINKESKKFMDENMSTTREEFRQEVEIIKDIIRKADRRNREKRKFV